MPTPAPPSILERSAPGRQKGSPPSFGRFLRAFEGNGRSDAQTAAPATNARLIPVSSLRKGPSAAIPKKRGNRQTCRTPACQMGDMPKPRDLPPVAKDVSDTPAAESEKSIFRKCG